MWRGSFTLVFALVALEWVLYGGLAWFPFSFVWFCMVLWEQAVYRGVALGQKPREVID